MDEATVADAGRDKTWDEDNSQVQLSRTGLLNKISELEFIIRDMLSKGDALAAEKEKARTRKVLYSRFAVIIFGLISSLIYAVVFESVKPGAVTSGFTNNFVVFGSILIVIGVIALAFLIPIPSPRHETFTGIDKEIDAEQEKVSKLGAWFGLKSSSKAQQTVMPEEPNPLEVSEAFFNSFAESVQALQARIDLQTRRSDFKASQLLDRGISYMKFGLAFYIASIVFWQVWARFFDFGPMIIIGMISCTIAFVVIEFLAAWFLKQFRSFNDSAFAYLRVRSQFDRYLLAYHALHEYPNSDFDGKSSRDCLIDLVSEDIKWPDLSGLQKNDFNYMLESMSSMTGVLDKMRAVIKKPKKSKAAEAS